MRKRVRVSIPRFSIEIIEKDMEYFSISRDRICNLVIQGLGFENTISYHKKLMDGTKILNFNLNEKNTELFEAMFALSKERKESEFFKRVFSTYANLHPFMREKILNISLFTIIENAIRENKKVKLYYQKLLLDVLPLGFERDSETLYTILKVKKEGKEYLYEMKNIEVVRIY
ncbi:hypothetical protein [Fusobacterium varium]|uniref:hypothetical protein n=1 Tax=Fusobacterium varium TaxID=856 RepID=UPI0035620279